MALNFTITTLTTAMGAGTPSRAITLTLTGSGTLGSNADFALDDGGAGGTFYPASPVTIASGQTVGATTEFVYIPAPGASGTIVITATCTGGLTATHSISLPIATNATTIAHDNFSDVASTNLIGRTAAQGGIWASSFSANTVAATENGSNAFYTTTSTGTGSVISPTLPITISGDFDVVSTVTNTLTDPTVAGYSAGTIGLYVADVAGEVQGYLMGGATSYGFGLLKYVAGVGSFISGPSLSPVYADAGTYTFTLASRIINTLEYLFPLIDGVLIGSGPAQDSTYTTGNAGYIMGYAANSTTTTINLNSNFKVLNADWASSGVSFTVAPTTDTNAQSVVYTLTGSGTSWLTGTTFAISGVTGASITSQSCNAGTQVGTVTVLFDNTHIGTLTFTDSVDAATATTAVTLAGPGIPASPSCTPGNNQNVLNWLAPPSGGLTATYNVYRGTTPGGESGTPLATSIAALTYTDSTAMNGTTYYYKIAAVNATGVGTHSAEVSGTPSAGPAMAVDISTSTNAQSVVYTLTGTSTSWVGGTTFGISGVTGAAITAQSVNTGAQTGSVTVLYDNTHIGTLTFSDTTDSATTTTAVTLALPGIPGSPSCTPGNSENTLNWLVPPSGGLTATYNVYRGTTPGGESGTPLATGVAVLTYVDSTAVNGTTYYYKIAAVNATGTGTHSSEVSGTPSIPTLVSGTAVVESVGDTIATVFVSAASGGVGPYTYQWYRSTISGFTPGGGNIVSGATSQTLNDTGLTNGITYYYVNVVTDSQPVTANSNQVGATPSIAPANINKGFQYIEPNIGVSDLLERVEMVASTQYYDGDACIMVDGILTQIADPTLLPDHIFLSMITPSSVPRPAMANLSTTLGERCEALPVTALRALKFSTPLTGNSAPPFSGAACNANTVANEVIFTGGGLTNDYQFGTVYIPLLGEQRNIVSDTVSGGVHTFVVEPAFSRPPTTGDTLIAVPFQKGLKGNQLAASVPYQGINTTVANLTGGHVNIEDVFLGAMAPDITTGNTLLLDGNVVPYAIVTFS